MKLKERIYKKCKCCKQTTGIKQEESYGCDFCQKPIDEQLKNGDTRHHHFLELRVFCQNQETFGFQCCSWKCLFNKLKTINTDNFVALPYLSYEIQDKGCRVSDFWDAIKAIK